MNLQEQINRIQSLMNVVNEGLHDTSWKNEEGDEITLKDLLKVTEDLPVKNIPIKKIKSKLLSWDEEEEHKKIEKSDLRYPILILVGDKNKFISIIDGHHRVHKAIKKGLKTIKAKLIPIDSLPKKIKKVFGHLQENRIQSISEKIDTLLPLYHKTSTIRGLDIINSDSLRGTLPSDEYLKIDKRLANTKTQRAISFTRDKNWEPNNTIGMGFDTQLEDTNMTFVLDKNKLNVKYRIEPFNYGGLDPWSIYDTKNQELEERVLADEIHPLHRYLIDIIYTGDDPEVQEKIDNYLKKG